MVSTREHVRPLARLVSAGLGLLLIAAAGAKLYGLEAAPYARHGLLTHPTVQLLVVEWELVLGLWLVSGVFWTRAWLAATLTFSAFAVVSCTVALSGQTSCGCFGTIQTNPWVVVGIDVASLLALVVVRPATASFARSPSHSLGPRRVATGLAGVLLVAAGWAGSWDTRVRAALLAEPISIRPEVVDVGSIRPGQPAEATVELTNHSPRPVRVIGGVNDCSCDLTRDLPLTLTPGERASIRLWVRPMAGSGVFTRPVFVWTDHPATRQVWFDVTGRVVSE